MTLSLREFRPRCVGTRYARIKFGASRRTFILHYPFSIINYFEFFLL